MHEQSRKQSLSTVIAVIACIPVVISGLLVTFGSLKVGVKIYDASIGTGLVLTFTGIPVFLLFVGSYTAAAICGKIWETIDIRNRYEKVMKFIGYSILGTGAVWLAYGAGAWIILALAEWLMH